jgi:hypothetical protein
LPLTVEQVDDSVNERGWANLRGKVVYYFGLRIANQRGLSADGGFEFGKPFIHGRHNAERAASFISDRCAARPAP